MWPRCERKMPIKQFENSYFFIILNLAIQEKVREHKKTVDKYHEPGFLQVFCIGYNWILFLWYEIVTFLQTALHTAEHQDPLANVK